MKTEPTFEAASKIKRQVFFLDQWKELKKGDGRKLHLLNSAYLILLPKKQDALQVKDYRPIRLKHSFAKLITKLMANRLAPFLDRMVSANQSVFIRGRCIHDNFLLVQQMARFLHRQREPRLLFKLDISKAFDSVSWSFLLEILSHLGFRQRWHDVLCCLLRSASSRVLLNGVPGNWINHRRALRQGDPLSLLLFILVMDALNALFSKAGEQPLLQPPSRRALDCRVSLYADDVALFIHPTPSDLSATRAILEIFGDASGLRTNMQKSLILPIRCQEEDLATVAEILPGEVPAFPCRYLGLPLSTSKLTNADLQPVVDRIADLLPGWKAALLSTADRSVLVKAVLTAVPIHMLIAMDVPKWLIRAIDKRRHSFLWKGRQEIQEGHCPVAWTRACRPPEFGGLGIHNLEVLSWALRMRWLWQRKTEPQRPWSAFDFPVHPNARALFAISVV
ncbi:hypothetical protein U9M48_038806 [Paspalum notatum var. saurae]|uniref:Reverse transcriptase domain-containing protein n=1 Tax=Paspalum notatum var. saurae TaxID=547442 RepID=A0AAQ3UJB3_PASNO